MADELISVFEASHRLGVAEATVEDLIDLRGLPTVRVGYGQRIWADELDAWLDRQRPEPE